MNTNKVSGVQPASAGTQTAGASAARKASRVILIAVFGIISVLSVLICTGIGSVRISVPDVIKALFVDDESMARLLIWNLRFPRVLVGGLVGVCLSLSGCILQGVMRNTMASPSTIGVTGGASFIGYLTLVAFPAYSYLLPIGSIFGAFITTMLIYALAYQKGVSPVKMILSGMAVSAMFGAFNDIINFLCRIARKCLGISRRRTERRRLGELPHDSSLCRGRNFHMHFSAVTNEYTHARRRNCERPRTANGGFQILSDCGILSSCGCGDIGIGSHQLCRSRCAAHCKASCRLGL